MLKIDTDMKHGHGELFTVRACEHGERVLIRAYRSSVGTEHVAELEWTAEGKRA